MNGANLSGVKLRGADLDGAALKGVVGLKKPLLSTETVQPSQDLDIETEDTFVTVQLSW